ncbi:MAG TPA: hypothetical protein PKY35_05380 [Candidatus Hydrogenedentes bacterium]|nr:hypothetical protein [Candidatus Hydrogenedentota bacterium]HOL76444.1 hypothetical protein [Candidatus Hydrogenedentota bacterium]HPO85482.1 hypothetical protein [Candidatus Hydrogenedentota bacterium]
MTKQSPQPRSARGPWARSSPKSQGDCHVVPGGTPRNDNGGDAADGHVGVSLVLFLFCGGASLCIARGMQGDGTCFY